jgi:hypothetical protein
VAAALAGFMVACGSEARGTHYGTTTITQAIALSDEEVAAVEAAASNGAI